MSLGTSVLETQQWERGKNGTNLSYNVVMANTKMCFLQDMGIKFFTNSKVRQPVVCTGETVRRQPFIVNAGHVASAHHVKSSGNTEDRTEIFTFLLKGGGILVIHTWTVLIDHFGFDIKYWPGIERDS